MRCAKVLEFGDKEPAITIAEDEPRPVFKRDQGLLLVKVLACSIAMGDAHTLSGRVSLIVKPPSFPYIPGKDICGLVVESDEGSGFRPGDYIVYSGDMQPFGGMAEYMLIKATKAVKKPDNVDVLSAASCADSAVTALTAIKVAKIKSGERVLVLGGSGGVGSAAVQLAKNAGASHVASTSTQTELLKSLGVDHCIDYRKENWWEIGEYQKALFDVVIDCVGGNNHYGKSSKVLKNKIHGGRFIAVVGDQPLPVVRNPFQLIAFACQMLWKPLWTLFAPWKPKYVLMMSQTDNLADVLQHISQGNLKIVLEPSSPFAFSEQGVRNAFKMQASGHAHGKVVVEICAS